APPGPGAARPQSTLRARSRRARAGRRRVAGHGAGDGQRRSSWGSQRTAIRGCRTIQVCPASTVGVPPPAAANPAFRAYLRIPSMTCKTWRGGLVCRSARAEHGGMNGQHTREEELIRQIGELVTEERALRQQPGHRLSAAEYERIKQVERALDQCWDLLRQR